MGYRKGQFKETDPSAWCLEERMVAGEPPAVTQVWSRLFLGASIDLGAV